MATDRSEPLEAKVDSVGGDQEFPPKPLGLPGASESNVGITGSGVYVGENWVEWAGRETEFVDGFGLCSPNLYRPEQRGAFLRDEAKKLAKDAMCMTWWRSSLSLRLVMSGTSLSGWQLDTIQ